MYRPTHLTRVAYMQLVIEQAAFWNCSKSQAMRAMQKYWVFPIPKDRG